MRVVNERIKKRILLIMVVGTIEYVSGIHVVEETNEESVCEVHVVNSLSKRKKEGFAIKVCIERDR